MIEAANLFLVRRLLVARHLGRRGFLCRQHHHLSLEPGTCPYGEEELRPVVDVGGELVHLAHLSGVDHVVLTERPERLDSHGGAAAILYAPLPGS